ncbi:hypothetical protein LTR08_002309 [Meristemomyces frigidus]|nr:hypothetical protein LTR08_002309 [Meristemomyces frigidus]
MPPLRTSTPHRLAALALFRALLAQTRALQPLGPQAQHALQNIIRTRFKQARHEQSAARLQREFEAGYAALDHVDAAVAGCEERLSFIAALVARAPQGVKQTPPTVLPKHLEIEAQKRRAADARSVNRAAQGAPRDLFSRPFPLHSLAGKRRVPVLYSAQKIPVLRLAKPQPQALSGYLAHRLRVRQKRHDVRHRLESEVELARAEDVWCGLVGKLGAAAGGAGGVGVGEGTWAAAPLAARRDVARRLEEEKRRNGVVAGRMQGVVDRERALYEAEKAQREAARRGLWVLRMKGWARARKAGVVERALGGGKGREGVTLV